MSFDNDSGHLCPLCDCLVETHEPGVSYVKHDGALYHPKCLTDEVGPPGRLERRARYIRLRSRMIRFFGEHFLPPETVVESSYCANQLNEFAAEMDSIAADALVELEEEFTAIRETELL